ncbi:pyridoxamine 5'-phosphate oxidase family protein [Brenneria roseae subsp. americana]|uniref:Pyridoxamine 5'-phosphate oxidase family protein n=1 Tax=Brenneria roseae subsp. americana TaxID=1508507 RepID=A0A2U1U2C9_9GAMM|nr:pyridoxamine 5'-phosphate oxidase family protein [Brenneria roseae]PWC15815.1 pyridoxamine 5'-phosphate oxidase family protein [Brenneria roseae subsp. americana]
MSTTSPSAEKYCPHGDMRRDDREITDALEIEQIIQASRVMYLALSSDDIPFVVPVFYAWDGRAFYFHSARSGTKIDIMKRNNKASFVISVDQGVIEDAMVCNFEARHRTVIGFGEVVFVDDEQEKITALNRIVKRFTTRPSGFPTANLRATQVIRLDILSLKGKKHGF